MMVYIGSGLSEDNSMCPMCVSCIMIAWVETPSTPPFICQGGVGFIWKIRLVTVVPNMDAISTCPIYKI
jgi:hypothetical protein